MYGFQWQNQPGGLAYRPPTLRVLVAPVVASPDPDVRLGAWGEEVHTEDLVPVRTEWGLNGRASTLHLRRVLGVGASRPARTRPEDVPPAAGFRVRLIEARGEGPVREWFRGTIAQERLVIQADPDDERADQVAYGPELLLRGKAVSGRWHAVPAVDAALVSGDADAEQLVRDNAFASPLPTVFNEGGRPNAAGRGLTWHLDRHAAARTPGGRVFDSPDRRAATDAGTYRAEYWTASTAVQSLIEWVDGYAVISPESVADLPGDLAHTVLPETPVEATDLLAALEAVLVPIGFGFCIEPWAGEDGRHRLRVFELRGCVDGGRVRRPWMAPVCDGGVPAETAPARRAEIQRIEFLRDNHQVTNDVTVVGDQKRRQAVLRFPGDGDGGDLIPAWDTDQHDLADWAFDGTVDAARWASENVGEIEQFAGTYAYGRLDAYGAPHAFRSFTWNEDAAYGADADSLPDLDAWGTGETGRWLRRPRPLGQSCLLEPGEAGVRNVPAMVQMGIAGDDASWIQVPAVVWHDRAGFTIPVDPLWSWYPYASDVARHVTDGSGQTLFEKYGGCSYLTLLYNALRGSGTGLRLRLVGSAECDQALIARAGRQAGSSWPLTAERVLRDEHTFRWREVAEGDDPFGGLVADVRDDAAAAMDLAERTRDRLADEVGHGSLILRGLTRAYAPGDAIPSTRGRQVDLTVRSGGDRRAPIVSGVIWSLEEGNCHTELLLDTRLLKVTP